MENRPDRKISDLLKDLLDSGVAKGVFPGAAGGIYRKLTNGNIKVFSFSGSTGYGEREQEVNQNTVFDLASLTKPLVTTLSLLTLIGEQRTTWDTSLGDHLGAGIGSDKKNIPLRYLVSHCSGMSPYRPFFKSFRPYCSREGRKKLLSLVASEPLLHTPGEYFCYSDLGFILLGEVVEQCSSSSLDNFFRKRLSRSLGLERDLFFRPQPFRQQVKDRERFAATEKCLWRGRVVRGEVHDEHCYLMGGVAGHAGLFGTVRGVLGLCMAILNHWRGRAMLPFDPELLQGALKRTGKKTTWCLGFDTPTPGRSSGGRLLSPDSVGHLGFTGTSFWIDPEKETIIVLLTNRVHPSRKNQKIKEFRPWFHDRIITALQEFGH
ncbi:serine hydrolase domain-containing protein [Desulfolithobacter sp.]